MAEMIFDFKEAVDTFLGNEDVVKRLVKEYCVKVEGQLPEIEKCIAEGDTEGSRGLAHSIKGSALNLSMLTLGEAAKDLEYSSRDGLIEQSEINFDQVRKAFAALKKYVESEGFLG